MGSRSRRNFWQQMRETRGGVGPCPSNQGHRLSRSTMWLPRGAWGHYWPTPLPLLLGGAPSTQEEPPAPINQTVASHQPIMLGRGGGRPSIVTPFSLLAPLEEVTTSLSRLENDLEDDSKRGIDKPLAAGHSIMRHVQSDTAAAAGIGYNCDCHNFCFLSLFY